MMYLAGLLKNSQVALVASMPAELTCLCIRITVVLWQTGSVGSEKCQWGDHAKCVEVRVRITKWLRSYFQNNRSMLLPPFLVFTSICSWVVVNLEFIGICLPFLVLLHFPLSEVSHHIWSFLGSCWTVVVYHFSMWYGESFIEFSSRLCCLTAFILCLK